MSIVQDVEKFAQPVLAEAGIELVDVEYRREPLGWTLRFYLDKAGGFSLTDCEEWNERLGRMIDENNLIPHGYSLEISSPGLDRPLKKPEDFQKYAGVVVVIKLFAAQNGQKNFHGRIVRLEDGKLLIEDRTNGLVTLPFPAIASARLDPKIDF